MQQLFALSSTLRERREVLKKECMGRSVGGLSTKIHVLFDALGNPTQFYLTPGQAHDLQGADALLPDVEADFLLADRADDAQERVIEKLQAKNGEVVIPSKSNRIEERDYDRHLYKARHLIENCFVKLKKYRDIATRYDKTAVNFLGSIHFAASVVWLNRSHAPFLWMLVKLSWFWRSPLL